MKIFKKILRGLAWSVGILLVLLILLAFSILKWPQYLINERSFRLLASVGGRFGAHVSWTRADIRVQSPGFLHKRFDFGFENFCFNLSQNKQQGCFEKFRVAADAAWLGTRLQVMELGPLQALGGRVSYTYEPSEKKQNTLELDLPRIVLPPALRQSIFQEVSLGIDELAVWTKGELAYSGRVYQWASLDERGRLKQIDLQAELDPRPATPSGKASFSLASPSYFMENDWVMKGSIDGFVGDAKVQASLQGQPVADKVYSVTLESDWRKKASQARGNLAMRLAKGLWRGNFSATLVGFVKQVEKIQAQQCDFSLSEIEKKKDRLHLNLDCPVLVDLSPMKLPSSSFQHLVKVPYNLDLRVKSDMETSFYPSPAEPVDGTLKVDMNTISQELLSLKGSTFTRFAGIPSHYPQGWALETKLDIQALLPQFKKLVRALEKTAYPVYAPLNDLDGSVELKVAGNADLAQQRGNIPLEFKTQLKSAQQSFNSQGKGTLNYQISKAASKTHLDFDFLMDDVKIVMPHLGYSTMPALFPDSRFVNPREKASAANPNLSYKVSVRTSKPAYLVSNLTKDHIPLILDLKLDEKHLGGSVKVGSTQLEFFRRNATVERFNLTLAEPRNKSVVDGLVRVRYADYTIDIIMLGAIERPKILFQSDPPLEQDQILSVLIYGRTFENLDAQNSSSVSAVSTAVADRAIALGSLFLLASSPIESVSYDPASRAFSAKIKLAQGMSLDVGTHEGRTQEVGLRKSLKGNWLIRTYFTNDPQTGSQKTGAMLEWYKRY